MKAIPKRGLQTCTAFVVQDPVEPGKSRPSDNRARTEILIGTGETLSTGLRLAQNHSEKTASILPFNVCALNGFTM